MDEATRSYFENLIVDNPILKLEIQSRLKLKKIIIALAVQGFFLLLIFIMLLAAELGGPVKVFFLAETILILFAAPLMTSNALSAEIRKGNAEQLFASPLTSYEILLGKLIGLEMYNLIFLILSFVILSIAAVFGTDIYLSDIAKIHIILLIYLYAFGALGILCSTIFKNFLYAAEMAYLVLAFLISDAVIIIPFIRLGFKASAMISLALHANPFTTVCSIINLDIFRTPYLYNLSPIASYGYTFPKWYLIALWYVLGLIGCFAIAVLKLKRET